jgi:2-polyprenyl-3-methyl-5-hydroxy-6-metoxy-1,4-benzoquinol methylase
MLTAADRAQAEKLLRKKAGKFLKIFKGSKRVLELGSSIGLFLGLCAEAGIPAEGVEPFAPDYKLCRQRYPEIPVHHSNALKFFGSVKRGKFDGLYMSNVIEHMEVAAAARLLGMAFKKLAPGAKVIITTANPECLEVMMKCFWWDKEHSRPYAPRVLKELLEEAGFEGVLVAEDEDTRPQGLHRLLLRKIRSVLVGKYFGPPEVYAFAHKP